MRAESEDENIIFNSTSKINTVLIGENTPMKLKVSERVNRQGNQTFIKAFNEFIK